ncbi:MAG: hypothetical protein J6T48_02120 [Bacteroidales bacterium]|nr:hypothetical protein [Bacteroidales bacterium]
MKKLKFDSTSPFKGILFQFHVALEKCFEMEECQSVYIETYGDVSLLGNLSNSKQIEAKFYKKSLTNLDKNVWNTIYNWMNTDFPIDKFSSFVLFTTQKIGKDAAWADWNNKSLKEREEVLKKIKKSFDEQKSKSKQLKKCMDVIFDTENKTRLSKIIEKLYIDSINIDAETYRKSIYDRYGKGVPKTKKERFIDTLMGYILRPEIVNRNWEISYESFSKEVEDVTKQMVECTTIFPAKLKLTDIKPEEYEDNMFVKKIQDIEYDEVIDDAIDDYIYTANLIVHDMQESETIKKSLSKYEDNIENNFRAKYRKASRNYNEGERIARSQDLYDDVISSNDGAFHSYSTVDSYFHNGMIHILTDEKDDLVWLLNKKTNE